MKNGFTLIMVIVFLLSGCSQRAEPSPSQEPIQATEENTEVPIPIEIEPTATDVPSTNTPEPSSTLPQPTPTAIQPTLTALPNGVLFRDDFEGVLQPGWTWINEDPARWSFVDGGWLEIVGAHPGFYQQGDFGIVNFLTRPVPAGEFEITAHIQSNPNENFQQATIFIFENQDNYIALNTGYCQPCPTSGYGFYMETIIDNNPFGDFYAIPRAPEDTDVYLQLINQGGSLTGYYATTPGDWQRVGAFGNYFDFKSVGLGTTNSNTEGVQNDIVSRFDYFEISQP